jgi:hypothetical protein
MNAPVPPLIAEVSEAEWTQTPESVKRSVQSLIERVEGLERQNQELTKQIATEVATLREQVQRSSQNSSQPPSQDMGKGFKAKAVKKSSGKRRGAQFGHEGHEPPLYAVETCERVETYYPEHCIVCGADLSASAVDGAPWRVQQVEIPPVQPIVIEHQFHSLRCECCGTHTRAWDEEILNSSRYGERVVAHVGVLSGLYHLSHRMVQELLRDLFGVELSVGSIAQLRQETSAAVAPAVAEAQAYVQQQAQVNMDETSFVQGNSDGKNAEHSKGWLWVMVTPLVSYFAVHLSRAGAVAQQ